MATVKSATTAVNVRIPTEKVELLTRIADLQDRDRSYLINQAVDQYLDIYEWQCAHIRESLRQAASGHVSAMKRLWPIFRG